MAISRQKKAELIEEYKESIEKSSAMVFTDYRGISVSQIQSLRMALQESGAVYKIVKNTLFGLALQQSDTDAEPGDLLNGPNAIVFLNDDIAKGATALNEWIKSDDIVEIKGAILDSSVLDAAAAAKLSDLPTREEVLAKLLGTINAPAGDLVRVLNAPPTDLTRMVNAPLTSLVGVLNAHIQKQSAA